MDFTKFLDIIKLKLSSRITGFLILLIITILPTTYKNKLGIHSVYIEYKTYISILLIVFAVLVIVGIGEKIYEYIKPDIENFVIKKIIRTKLKNLTDIEKDICRTALENSGMITLKINEGNSANLEHYKILSRVSNMSVGGTYFAYRLNDYPLRYLERNIELLNIEKTS